MKTDMKITLCPQACGPCKSTDERCLRDLPSSAYGRSSCGHEARCLCRLPGLQWSSCNFFLEKPIVLYLHKLFQWTYLAEKIDSCDKDKMYIDVPIECFGYLV